MAQKDKLIDRFKRLPHDFKYDELVTLLRYLGYEEHTNSGSRRCFIHSQDSHIIYVHEPHPGNTMKMYSMRDIYDKLKERNLL